MVIPPISLILGGETTLRDEKIKSIKSQLFTDASQSSLNTHSYRIDETPLSDILTQANTAPFLSDKRLIILDQIESFKESDKKQLLAQIEKTAEWSVWIIMSKERTAKTAFLKKLALISQTYNASAPYQDSEIARWIRQRFEVEGKKVGYGVVEILFDRVGKSLSLLDHAIAQLALYVGEKSQITSQDAEALLGGTSDQNVFELYDAIKARQMDKMLRILNDFRDKGRRTYEIITSLIWQFQRMLQVKNMLMMGEAPEQIGRKMNIHRFFLDKVLRNAKALDQKRFKADLESLIDCERSIKSGLLKEDLAFDRCLLSLYQA